MPPAVAIVMRAKDEMPYVQQALERLSRQTYRAFDLYAVDSGSTDGTLEALKHSPARITQIPPGDYVPGKVLNDAVARTEHDFIVLLNADGIPTDADWLGKLLAPLLEKKAEASFCRQVPRPDARFIVQYDYERAYQRKTMRPGFFSAVACAFTRELWQALPFPETGYAEDARWAAEVIRSGHTIEYVGACAVEHSHNYTLKSLFTKRYRQALTQEEPPRVIKQAVACLREIFRDFIYALRRLKLHTVPYNIAYRTTIHRAVYRGLKEHG
ncbi:glycosyltransferase family 2 protein [Pontiella sp.]|uniref:glycosyltransferase family 2 protein n=1 Tax=Pontiella sp. TaxID=2837462 RepID=UPI0035672B0D